MNITPKMEAILHDYAEHARLTTIRWAEFDPRIRASFAIKNPEQFRANCRDDAIKAIRDGKDSWERIEKFVLDYRKKMA